MKRRFAVLAVVVSALFAGVAAAPSGAPVAVPEAAFAKACSAGWKHAVLPTGHKCLRAGQFCASRSDATYHRYGYHCHTGRLVRK